jgi:hypothetical protein
MFFAKNDKFKAILKVYYMMNDITAKLKIIMIFLNWTRWSNLGLKSQMNYKLEQREYFPQLAINYYELQFVILCPFLEQLMLHTTSENTTIYVGLQK